MKSYLSDRLQSSFDLPAKRIAYTFQLDMVFVLWFHQIFKDCFSYALYLDSFSSVSHFS